MKEAPKAVSKRPAGQQMLKLLESKDLLAVSGGATPGPRTPPKSPPRGGGTG